MKKFLSKIILILILLFAITSGFFHYEIYAAADKTALNEAHDEVVGINNDQTANSTYEADSFQAFTDAINALGGLSGIETVINDDAATQTDVDNLAQDINDAINGLILNDIYNATSANFFTAKALDLTPYTSASRVLYNEELDRIEVILNDPQAGTDAINALNTDIDAAVDLLVLRGDKTELLVTKSDIEAIYQSTGVDYIPSTFEAFKTAYDDIDTAIQTDFGETLQQLIDDVDATQPQVDLTETRLTDVLNILVERPDKTTLMNEYSAALLVDESDYTSSSYTVFEAGLILINNVINNVEATQPDVSQALTDLADLFDALEPIADVTTILSEYNDAIAMDLSSYTPNSVVDFETELNRIHVIFVSDDTNQEEADTALTDLRNAYDLLVEQANRSELSSLNDLVIQAYYEQKTQYTESSYQQFKTQIDNIGSYLYVNSVINNDNVDQTTVDNLVQQLQDALDLLNPIYDNSSLLILYSERKNKDLTGYTSGSIFAYNNELNRLFDIITGKEFDADAAIQASQDLMNSVDLLILLPDMTELQNLCDSTSIYREEDYSISSYGAFEVAKTNANNVLNNDNANEEMVQDAYDLLQTAIDNLAQKQQIIYIFEGDSLNINQYVTLGEATINGYSSGDTNIIMVDNQGVIQGLHFGETNVFIDISDGYTEMLTIHVKAKLSTAVIVLTFTIPVASVGFGAAIIYVKKDTWLALGKKINSIFNRKK